MKQRPEKFFDEHGNRLDGRQRDEMRPVDINIGVLSNADGSALVSYGKTKVIAAVYGPREPTWRYNVLPDRASLYVRYHMAPFSTEERKSPAPTRREIELSKVIRESLEPVVMTELFPRTAIEIYVEVLQSDGGTRTASITAASAALADAGIPMRALVGGVAIGKVDGVLVLDLNEVEDNFGEADMPVAAAPDLGLITLFQLNGVMTLDELKEGTDMALKAIERIVEKEKQALRESATEVEAL